MYHIGHCEKIIWKWIIFDIKQKSLEVVRFYLNEAKAYPASIYLFKANNRKRYEYVHKKRQNGVIEQNNFETILDLLLFLLLTLNK